MAFEVVSYWGCPFSIQNAHVGHGSLGIDCDLGYNGLFVTNVFGFRWTVSAHADSCVTILVHRPTRLRGFLNGTATHCTGAEFVVDSRLLGTAYRPFDVTAELILSQGRHSLAVRAPNGNSYSHAVWGFDGSVELEASPQHDVVIGAICKDENAYIEEWIRYHRSIGIGHFFLLDNNSRVPLQHTLQFAGLECDTTVEIFPHLGSDTQNIAYMHLLRKYGFRCRWMALIDIDEFIVPKANRHLPTFMTAFEEYGALMVQWVMFGSNDLEHRPQSQLRSVTDSYVDPHVKCIVQPRFVSCVANPHIIDTMPGRPVVSEHFDSAPSTMHIQLNHYWTRSRSEWADKIARGAIVPGYERNWLEYSRHQSRCRYRDTSVVSVLDAESARKPAPTITPVVGFVHVAAINHWKAMLKTQLDKICRSGLINRVDHIDIGIVGADDSIADSLNFLPSKARVVFCRPNMREYEFPTLQHVQNICRQQQCYVWYIHSKGVTNPHGGQSGWRNKMEEFVLVNHGLAVSRLEQGYSVAAAFGSLDLRWPIPGNFWWATSTHIASLPDVSSLNQSNRWEAERWITSRNQDSVYYHDWGDTKFEAFEILRHESGAGRVSTNGYHSWLRMPVLFSKDWPLDVAVSSHAPSHITIECKYALRLYGFTCENAKAGDWLIEFQVDDIVLGILSGPGERTADTVISPGRHELKIQLLQGVKWGAHTVWSVCWGDCSPMESIAVTARY